MTEVNITMSWAEDSGDRLIAHLRQLIDTRYARPAMDTPTHQGGGSETVLAALFRIEQELATLIQIQSPGHRAGGLSPAQWTAQQEAGRLVAERMRNLGLIDPPADDTAEVPA